MVMMAAFFKLSEVIPYEEAEQYMKQAVKKSYGKKGDKIVNMNYAAIDNAISGIEQINYPESWADTKEGAEKFHVPATKYFDTVVHPILAQKGDSLPVSTFDPSGYVPTGTTQYEKRGIAVNLPEWIPENCIPVSYTHLDVYKRQVITDEKTGVKYPLADYELLPLSLIHI